MAKIGNDPLHCIVCGTCHSDKLAVDGSDTQGRLDGAVCEYTEADKMAYLQEVSQKVILNEITQQSLLAQMTKNAR